MAVVSMKQLLDSGVHFGHQTRRWNPKMKRFIFTERNGIYIIDLQQTLGYIDNAYEFVKQTVAHGGSILFVGTKRQAQEVVAEQAQRVGMPYVNQRWLGGMLTNFQTVHKRLQRLKELEDLEQTGALVSLSKKEQLVLSREKAKLERSLGGIRDMQKVPSAVWIVDTKKEHIAVGEARKLGIPVVAILDTNCDPDEVDYKIPGNDDAIRSITVLTRVIADAVAEGLMARSAAQANAGREEAAEPRHRWRRAAGRLGARAAHRRRRHAEAPAAEAAPPPRPPPPPRPRPRAAAEPRAEAAARRGAPRRGRPPPSTGRGRPTGCRPTAVRGLRRRRRARPGRGRRGPARPPHHHDHRGRDMADFTAADVKRLRDATGAGMMDCKKALTEADGDYDKAVEILRVKGAKDVGKRLERSTTNGVVVSKDGALLELDCETDFVAKNADFVTLAERLLDIVLAEKPADVDALLATEVDGQTVAELIEAESARIGEKLVLSRFAVFEGTTAIYLHKRATDLPPAIGVAVQYCGGSEEAARSLAMHIAAARPALPHPRRGPGRGGRDRAPRRRADRQGGGQARAGDHQDRRGSGQRLLQGLRPARAAVDHRAQAHGQADRRRGRPDRRAVRPLRGRPGLNRSTARSNGPAPSPGAGPFVLCGRITTESASNRGMTR